MGLLQLKNTERLMQNKAANEDFDSYAVYVRCGDFEHTFFSENVNEDTYFDLASCGKILVTTPLILQAIGEKQLSLDSTLDTFFENVPWDKKNITIKHLLTHTSGIVRHQYVNSERDMVAKEILDQPLAYETGTDYRYSCSGMVLLGFVLEKIYGASLEKIFEERLKKPMGYTRSKFNIGVDEENAALCCRWKDHDAYPSPWDDENSRVLGTSSGAGGQFFTLSDIKKFAKAVLNKDTRLYPEALYDLSEEKYTPDCAKDSRGLGWLYVDEKYAQTGKLFPKGSFGHCGHAGQSIFFNREKDLCVVILTNATRFLNMRSGFKGYDYNEICKMRECIHNEILMDLQEQGLM
jgi:CubicO group peptidase (beta-lactamase class C family)